MKNPIMSVYVVLLHLVVIGLLIDALAPMFYEYPVETEWQHGRSLTEDQQGMLPGVADSEMLLLRIDGELIGVIAFESKKLDYMYFGWPGDTKEYGLDSKGASVNTDGDVIRRGGDGFSSLFWDLDGDGIFELESRREETESSERRAEWNTIWQKERFPDGTFGPREIFAPDGTLAFRVTELLPPVPQNASPQAIANAASSQAVTYRVERFEAGAIISTEELSEEEYRARHLVREIHGDWP